MRNDKKPKPIGRRPSQEGRKTFWLLVCASTVLGMLGVGQTWTRVAVTERKYQLAAAKDENERLTNELRQLDLEVETYESAQKIDDAARAFAMAKSAPTAVRVVPPMIGSALADDGNGASQTLAANERGR